MANVNEIEQIASALIDAFDKTSSPNDIIEAFENALDRYEELINLYHQNK
jgi:hypothetical protein